MSELSRLERERNDAWNDYQYYRAVTAAKRDAVVRAEADERAAKQRLDDLNAQLAQEQEASSDSSR